MKPLLPALLLLCFAFGNLRAADREIFIASPHWEGVQTEFGDAFARWYREQTGRTVAVRWLDLGGTSQIEKAIDALYQANPASCGIDVFFGGGIDPFLNRKAKGQLEPFRLPDDVLSHIPPAIAGVPLVDPDYDYYGAAVSSFGILENLRIRERLRLPPVATWEDLARPEFFNWVSSADPRKSGSVHMIYEIILQAYGWEKGWSVIYRTSGNVRSFLQASPSPAKEIAAGDAAEAVTIDLNGLVEVAALGSDNVRFVVPQNLSVITPDGIGILKGAPDPDVARAFVTFVMSAPGQALWMRPVGTPDGPVRYPISRMGVWLPYYQEDPARLAVPFNPFATTNSIGNNAGFTYDSALGSRRWNVVNDLLGQTAIDVHSRMQKAWAAILRVPEPARAPLAERFAAPFASEADALADAEFWRTDKVRAGQIQNEWMAAAVQRYETLTQEAERAEKITAHQPTSAP